MLRKLFTKKTPYEAFWDWFIKNEKHYYWMDKPIAELFSALNKQLNKINPGLTYEFGVEIKADKREMILSADGVSAVFPDVIKLMETAPSLDKWKFIAFRQPTGKSSIIVGNLTLDSENVVFAYSNDTKPGEKLDIIVFAYNYVENVEWDTALFILLDSMIGEYNVATKLGEIDFYPMPTKIEGRLLPITELSNLIDQIFPIQ